MFRLPPLCSECLKRATFTPASGPHGLCAPHLWRAEALGLDMEAWWRRWFTRSRGAKTRALPNVLDPDFPLRTCPVCSHVILPWQKWATRRGKRMKRWCIPSEYEKRQTCGSAYCAQDLAKMDGEPGAFWGSRVMTRQGDPTETRAATGGL